MADEDVQARRDEIEAKLRGQKRQQLDELAERRGLDPNEYGNKDDLVQALLDSGNGDLDVDDTSSGKSPGSIPSHDLMMTDPEQAQQERFPGTTSDAATREEGTVARDVPPDPNDDPDKPSDDPDYDFPPQGDVDVATVDAGSGEGERLTKPTLEDWVVLDGSHEQVPDVLDGRRAAIINVHPENAWDERDLLKEEYEPEDVSLTVRTRDDYGATLYLPLDAIKDIQRRGVSPVRT